MLSNIPSITQVGRRQKNSTVCSPKYPLHYIPVPKNAVLNHALVMHFIFSRMFPHSLNILNSISSLNTAQNLFLQQVSPVPLHSLRFHYVFFPASNPCSIYHVHTTCLITSCLALLKLFM